MNKKAYIPLSLMETARNIRQIHNGIKKSNCIEDDEEYVKNLIIKISSMEKDNIERKYLALITHSKLIRDLYIFCDYLPRNYLNVNLANISYIVYKNMSDDIFKRLYTQWSDYYDSDDIAETTRLLCSCIDDERCQIAVDELHLKGTYSGWVESTNVEKMVCFSLLDKAKQFEISNINAAKYFGVYQRKIYSNAMKYYYLCCGEREYYMLTDDELFRIIKNYHKDDLENFIDNFLDKMDFESIKNVMRVNQTFGTNIWKIIYSAIDSPESKKFSSYFAYRDNSLQISYLRWYNLRQADIVFGNDNRGNYWKSQLFKFDDVEYTFHRSCDGISMRIQGFTFIEFRQSGPLYAFSNEYFKEHIKKFLERHYNNNEMRQTLLHDHTSKEGFSNRIEHRGYWMYETDSLINRLVN